LIKETPADPRNTYQASRVGFGPDVLIQVVGTSFEGRQGLLNKVHAFCEPEFTPPCKLRREPLNIYDSGAVAVWAGTYYVEGRWTYSKVGFLPKNYSIPYRNSDHNFSFDEDIPKRRKVWELIDQAQDSVHVGIEGVYKVQGNYGMRLGLSHLVKNTDFSDLDIPDHV
tara:strand:- start:45 stop:548 length:504 start_codon:yes stop_codon:yes gene_type:complete